MRLLLRINEIIERKNNEIFDIRFLNNRLRRLKQSCLEEGMGYLPHLLKKKPRFAKKVDEYIKQKSRDDLPQEQFEDRLKLDDLPKWVEVGGVLDYRDGIKELSYNPPNSDNVIVEYSLPKNSSHRPIKRITTHTNGKLSVDDVVNATCMIDWHTHPVGYGELSLEDVDYAGEILKHRNERPFYMVLFQPNLNQTFWYNLVNFNGARRK